MDLVEAKRPVGNRHPWELARAAFFDRLILNCVSRKRPIRVLDVGCGDAWFGKQLLAKLPPGSELVGWDVALDDELLGIFSQDLPSGMSLTNRQPEGIFDLLLLMDVIEHVADDRALLVDVKSRYLKQGGQILITVPAWMRLFSAHDLALRHYRRYTPKTGLALINATDLAVLRKGGLFHALAIVRALQVLRSGQVEPLADPGLYSSESERIGLGTWNAPTVVTKLVSLVLELEGLVSQGASVLGLELPGLSWWALCTKR